MGIVNVTPDSFSDGGQFYSADAAIEHGLQLVADGAEILDIGGESTRPYADPISEEEELRRIQPVVAGLAEQTSVPISIDTTKAQVAQVALEAGAEIINDISGLEADPQMVTLAREHQPGVCVMHMQGTPQTMQDAPHYQDVVAEVREYLTERRKSLIAAGIESDRLCLDPGIGFGKRHNHNLRLLANCWTFLDLGAPVLVGHSRKGFIAKLLNEPTSPLSGTLGVALGLTAQGVQILRVHDVAEVRQALVAFAAAGGARTAKAGEGE